MSRGLIEISVKVDDEATDAELDAMLAAAADACRQHGATVTATGIGWMLAWDSDAKQYEKETDPYDGEGSQIRFHNTQFGNWDDAA